MDGAKADQPWLSLGHFPLPPLHDAEVVSLRLERGGPSTPPSLELDVCFVGSRDQLLVRFRFEDIADLELAGFNHQNVLFDIAFRRATADGWEVELDSTYGLGALSAARGSTPRSWSDPGTTAPPPAGAEAVSG